MLVESLVLLACCAVAHAKVQFLGVAIAGGDFGCQIDGTCPSGSAQLPLSSLGGADGLGQMKHFVKKDGMNMFRLPTSWQFLSNNNPSGGLDATNFGKYDQLVQACLGTGAYCMVDIHNFARFNTAIIGQGGPADDQFVGLWTQIATKYAQDDKVVLELMNEPHDLDVAVWAQTCQKVVTAVREAGATSQMVLLPGSNFDSAATLVSSGSADALMAITNPDGTTDGLLLDIHKYLDVDNSGSHAECTTDNVGNFTIVADYLRQKGRRGLVSETGASGQPSCMAAFCAQNTFINENADVFVGLVAWGAGGFDSSYVLSLTPSGSGGALEDKELMTRCVVAPWAGSEASAPPPPSPSPSSSSSSSQPSSGATWTATAIGSYTMTMTLPATERGPGMTTLIVAPGTPNPSAGLRGGGGGGTTSLMVAPSQSSGSSGQPSPTASRSGASALVPAGTLLAGCALVALFM